MPSFCFGFLFRAFGLGYKSKKSLLIGLILYIAYIFIAVGTLITVIGYGRFTHISSLVMLLANLPILLFTTDSIGKTIFLLLAASQVNTVVSVILSMAMHTFSFSYLTLVALLCAVCPLVLLLMLKYMAGPLRFMADNLHAEVLTLIVIPLIIMVVIYLIPVYPARNFEYHPVFCTVMMLLVECIFFLFLYSFYRNLKKLTVLMRAERKQELLLAEIRSYQDSLAAAKQTRHDARHHNALLLEYLDEGNIAAAKEYLHTNQRRLADDTPVEYCRNTAANAVLRIYQREADDGEIAYAAAAEIPEKLPLSEPELGTLLSNLLENAVEASLMLPAGQRSIALRASAEGGSLKIEVTNHIRAQAKLLDGLPQTTKPGGGTGTKSIAAIVERHGGMLRFHQDDDRFTAQVLLPME
jgi:signal transduction histidine kinase